MDLRSFCSVYGITLVSENLPVKGNYNTLFEFKINECGHVKEGRVGNIRRSGITRCNSCKDLEYIDKYDLKINREKCYKRCTLCRRRYDDEKETLTRWLDKYNCFCKLKMSHAERKFFDIAYKKFRKSRKMTFIRSYKKYNIARKNYSSDFYVKRRVAASNKNDAASFYYIDYIIHIDDKSHENLENQNKDIIKLQHLLERNDNSRNIYVQQKILFDNIDEILDIIEEFVNQKDSAERVLFIQESGTTFYDYLKGIPDIYEMVEF